ncbi:MAG: hypothetical protein IJG35_01145 [Bacteroidales bacterium]|nr:hypothetical protein [Bacteroidales bacterium]
MSDKLKKARKFILGGLLTVLGFSSCDPDDPDDRAMYGSPVYMYGPPAPSGQYQSQQPDQGSQEPELPVSDQTLGQS